MREECCPEGTFHRAAYAIKDVMIGSVAMKIRLLSARRAFSREQASFETLIASDWDALWRYAYRTTGNRDEAEDLLSETLLEGFKSIAQFRGETPFVRWMYRIMTTTRIDMVRRAASRQADSLDALCHANEADGGPFDIPDENADLEKVVIGPMLSEQVQRALLDLPEEFRAVVILVDMEQLEYAEVSRLLQVPVGTVRSRLHRGRSLLRRALAASVEIPEPTTPY